MFCLPKIPAFQLTLGLIVEESVDLGDGSVEANDSETVVSSIQDQVLTHDSKANETEVTTRFDVRREAGSNASQTRTKVSMAQSTRGTMKLRSRDVLM